MREIQYPNASARHDFILKAELLSPSAVAQMIDMSMQGFVVHRGAEPLYLNRAMAEMVGLEYADSLMTTPILHWIHEKDRPLVAANVSSRLEGKKSQDEIQFRLRPVNGAELWVNCRATLVDWIDGPAILATCVDITLLKHTERAHERSNALFERVFQATPDMMSLSYLRSGLFLDVNDNFSRAVGLDRESIMGKSLFDLEIWEDPTMAVKIAAAIRRHGSIRDMQTELRSADGSVFPISFSAESIEMDGETVVLIIGRDIRVEKRREEELRKSRDAAELANRTKSEFMANMSHELRTPLNAILGFSEIIEREVLGPLGDPRYKGYAADVYRSGKDLLLIINDILDLSKVEAGRLEIYPSEVDVEELLTQCLRLVRARAQEAGLALEAKTVPQSFSFSADRRLTKQILLNLLTNAIKFTEDGGHVHVTAEETEDGGCRLIVEDTGIGMSEDEIEKALTPFGQVDGTMTRRHEGTGLGLPLVAAFVDVHKGTLDISSTKGQGTKVTVTLPDAEN